MTRLLKGERKVEPPTVLHAAEAEFELAHFRPPTALPDASFGITDSPVSDVDDARLVARLLAAYRVARAEHVGCGESMWQGFFDAMQIPLDEAFRGDSPVEATRLLRDRSLSNHFYGFDNLCAALEGRFVSPEAQAQAAVS